MDTAAKLELTPEKSTSARSTTPLTYLGEALGNLTVIAFNYTDGTGDESTRALHEIAYFDGYMRSPQVSPRSKAAVHSEAHLTIAIAHASLPEDDPQMFKGSLDLIGHVPSTEKVRLGRLAQLGQDSGEFIENAARGASAEPTATLTTGYLEETGERFGDPHAVFNAWVCVQVAAFVALPAEFVRAHPEHADALRALGATVPHIATPSYSSYGLG